MRPNSQAGELNIGSRSSSLISHQLALDHSSSESMQRKESKGGGLPPLSKFGRSSSKGQLDSKEPVQESTSDNSSRAAPLRQEKSSKSLADSLGGLEGVARFASSWTQGSLLNRPATASSKGMMMGDARVMEDARERLKTMEMTNSNLRRMAGSPGSPSENGLKYKSRFQQQKSMEQDCEASAYLKCMKQSMEQRDQVQG